MIKLSFEKRNWYRWHFNKNINFFDNEDGMYYIQYICDENIKNFLNFHKEY